jgi:hypothetical protein
MSPVSSCPWSTLLQPALLGRAAEVDAAFTLAQRTVAPAAAGRLLAVGARAYAALGASPRAARLRDAALSRGASEAIALASVFGPDAPRWARARAAAGRPGDRADAWCDLAWHALLDGDAPGAEAAVGAAQAACPAHAEAARWARLLAQAGADTPPVVLANPAAPAGWASASVLRSAAALVPRPELGWLSPERLRRRVCTGRWPAPAPATSALGRLQDDGVVSRILATDAEYAALPAHSPLVDAERQLDLALSLDHEHLPAGAAAEAAWEALGRADAPARAAGVLALARLGGTNREAAAVALRAVGALHHADPDRLLWTAQRARLLAVRGASGPAVTLARLALARPAALCGEGLVAAVEALRICGLEADAWLACRRAATLPGHGAARALLDTWDTAALPVAG